MDHLIALVFHLAHWALSDRKAASAHGKLQRRRLRVSPEGPKSSGWSREAATHVVADDVPKLAVDISLTDCPREVYGPEKTPYNRFVRWAVDRRRMLTPHSHAISTR